MDCGVFLLFCGMSRISQQRYASDWKEKTHTKGLKEQRERKKKKHLQTRVLVTIVEKWCPVAVETRALWSALHRGRGLIWRGFHVSGCLEGHLIIHTYWLLPMLPTAIWLYLAQRTAGVPAPPCSHPLRRYEFTDAVPTTLPKNMTVITVWCGGYIRL